MRRPFIGLAASTLIVAGILVLFAPARAAESPLAGNWKVTLLPGSQEVTLWLLQIVDKDGKPQASVLSTHPNFKDTKIEGFRADDKSVHLTLNANGMTFAITAYPSPNEKMPSKVLGSVSVRGDTEFLRLERTDAKELDPAKAVVAGPAQADYQKADRAKDEKEHEAALRDILAKHGDQPAGYFAALRLLGVAVKGNAEADARSRADQSIKIATPFGPEAKRSALREVAQILAGSDKLAALQLDYARQAAALVNNGDPAGTQVPVLKLLASALRKTGKADEAKPLEERVAKLDDQLDQEFLKNAVPFKPEPFAGRKGKSDHVAVLELFTGAQCPPCVAADVAFDALLQTYKPADVVLLQYHLHIPGPDPLTNKDSEKRAEYYRAEATPAVFLSGKEGPPVGGPKQLAKDRYDVLRKRFDELLGTAPQGQLKLTAERKEDRINLQAEVADLKTTGDKVRLRFVLIEDVVRYPGGNGQRLHHHVVRAMPGGVEGIALKEKSGKHNVSITMAELRKALGDYLDDFAKKEGFLDDERPLDLKNLKVAALIQDDTSKEIIQAAQVDLPEGK